MLKDVSVSATEVCRPETLFFSCRLHPRHLLNALGGHRLMIPSYSIHPRSSSAETQLGLAVHGHFDASALPDAGFRHPQVGRWGDGRGGQASESRRCRRCGSCKMRFWDVYLVVICRVFFEVWFHIVAVISPVVCWSSSSATIVVTSPKRSARLVNSQLSNTLFGSHAIWDRLKEAAWRRPGGKTWKNW